MIYAGFFNLQIATVVCDAASRCLERISCSRLSIVYLENGHYFGLSGMPALKRRVSTVQTCLTRFCRDLEKILVSSKKQRASWHHSAESVTPIVCLNVPGAFGDRNVMQMKRNRPRC